MNFKIIFLTLFLIFTSLIFGQSAPFYKSIYISLEGASAIPERQPEQKIEGRVVDVYDGNTCTVLDADKKQWKIRFAGIDAPELKQPFGKASKKHLSDLTLGRNVTVISGKTDKYGRFVGKMLLEGKDINYVQILFGYARHDKKYQDEQSEEDRKNYAEAEEKAKAAKRGIWSQSRPTPLRATTS